MTPGSIIGGRFVVTRRAGGGGMGTVFQAVDRRDGRAVAIKILHGQDETDIERFVREAAILAELCHPNIVGYAGHGITDSGEHFLAMEWLDGEDLATRVARLPLSDAETLAVVRQMIDALACAHARGAVHRDIKPSNVFLRERDVTRVALVDFGIAGIAGDTRRLTQTGALLGTPGYMAPELVEGRSAHDPRSDVFSLGCVLFECLTQRPAFEGANPMAVLAKLLLQESPRVGEHRPEIPELDALVSRMLAKDPADRPASVADVAAALSELPHGLTLRPAPPRASTAAPIAHGAPGAPGATLHSAEPQVAEVVALGRGEHRIVTVVLAGDPSADRRARGLPASALHDLAAAIEPFGGHATPLARGSLIITTWTPGTALDRAERAALCAFALRERFPEIPIALVTGRGLVAARVVEGDVIDRGARSLAWTPLGQVSLDENTAGMLAARFIVERDGDAFRLRGAAAAHDAVAPLLGKLMPCLGRARELAMLEGVFSGCVSEPVASAVLVTGPAGVGKSRLRREFVDKLRRRGAEPVEVLIGRSDSLVQGTPFAVIADVIRGAAGIRDGEPLPARQKKLAARLSLSLHPPMLGRVASFLGELISTPFPDSGDAVLVAARDNAMLMGDAMRAAWEEWLIAECARGPVVLVLEDLQWGDSATARLIDSTVRNLSELPLMVLALTRPEAQGDLVAVWTKRDVPVIRLGPLPGKASERLVREALGPAAGGDVVRRVVDRAGGNPFYLEELIRAVAAGRGDVLPDSVLGTVEARLDAEGSDAKRVLRAASVFGDRFWVGGVASLLGGERHAEEARRVLSLLSTREIVAPAGSSGTEYVFCHALVREAAYAMLPEVDRTLGHRLAGDWLEREGHTDAMAMAEHFRRGDEPARAVRWYRRAAEQALEANDLGAVLERCRLGIACGAAGVELGSLLLVEAEAHVWRGELEEGEARGTHATELLEEGGTAWFRAVQHVINAAGKLGGIDRVALWISVVGAAVPARGALRAQIICLSECPVSLVFGGHSALADELIATIERTAAADPSALDAEVVALLHQMHAVRAYSRGDLGTCLERFAAAMGAFEEAGDQRNACTTRSNLGATFVELGDFEAAEEVLRAALAGAERMGLHDSATAALCNLGQVLAYRGNLDEARLFEQRAAEAFQRHRDVRMEGLARTYLARIALLSGDHAAAERSARAAEALLHVAPPLQPYAGAVLSWALLRGGRAGEALTAARAAFAALDARGSLEEGEALVRLVLAEALAGAGDTEGFRAAILSARDHLLARAAKILDPVWRERFLHGVPDNARTMDLAAACG